MNHILKRSLALLLALVLCISLLPATRITTDAADFEYVYDSTGKYIYNWGTRGETATSLSPNAEAFYQTTTYDVLAANAGGTGTSNASSSDLYAALQALMKNNHHYETSYDATRDLFQYTDCQNSAKDTAAISSFYSGVSIGPIWDGGQTWNREHTWPNSKGLDGNDENDIMMLRPTAKSENGARGNKAYGASTGYYFPNTESGGIYDVRGDVARIFLYVYVRWGNVNGNSTYGTVWGTPGVIESLDVLLQWMKEDPVDTWELGRNDSVEAITGTRNVFVDYPEFAFLLFGANIPADMTTPSGEASGGETCTHNYNTVVTAPTCTEQGYTTYTCTLCGYSYNGNAVAATGHRYENGVCTGCGKAEVTGEKVTISFADKANRTEWTALKQVWQQNGITVTNLKAASSTNVADYANPARFYQGSSLTIAYPGMVKIEVTCNSTEYATNLVTSIPAKGCTVAVSGKVVTITLDAKTDEFLIEKLSKQVRVNEISVYAQNGSGETPVCQHTNTETLAAVAPTCTTTGLTEGSKCADCGKVLTPQTEIPATGHDYENGVCTNCGQSEPSVPENSWTKIDLADITESDIIAITMTKGSNTWALYNANGTGTAPIAVVVNVNGDTMTCDNVETLSWNISNTNGKLIIYVAGTTSRWLYSTNTNNGTRVGTNSNKTWILDASSGYLKHEGTNRYLGVYIDKPDWRSYTNTTGNTAGQTLSFWKLNTPSDEPPACQHINVQVLEAVAPTCAAPGLTEGSKCADCGEVLIPQTEIPALDHNYVGGCTVIADPTETTTGKLTGACVVCSAPVEVELPALNMVSYKFTVVTAPADGNAGIGCFAWNETAYGEFSFEVSFRYGDVNGDGKVSGQDVVQLRRFMANYDYDAGTSTATVFAGADVNGDGKVTGQDVVLLRRYMANFDYDTGTSTVPLGPQN